MKLREIVPGLIAIAVLGGGALAASGEANPVAPELTAGPWVSGKPTTLAAQRGKVVVLTFWTTNCINCKRTLPFWNAWAKRYAGAGDVSVISVHTPETQWERDPAAVRRAAQRSGLTFPILIDNDSKNWDAYGVQAWPTTILIDKQGRIRNRWEGELDFGGSGLYREVEAKIAALEQEKTRPEGKDRG